MAGRGFDRSIGSRFGVASDSVHNFRTHENPPYLFDRFTESRRLSLARVSTCLNFPRSTEAAFVFYKAVFGGEFTSPIMRFGMHWMFNCASKT